MENDKRILVIADIHGCFEKLVALWKKISVKPEDLVIFLGDYVDRGRENVKVLKWIMNESKKKNVVALCGNHDDMLKTDILAGYVKTNVYGTLGEIAMQNLKEPRFVDEVFKFLKNLPYSFEIEIGKKKYFFCHAGIDPTFPLEEQAEEDFLWIREKFFSLYDGEKIIVVGHTSPMFLKADEEIKQKLTEIQNRSENRGKNLSEIIDELVAEEYEAGNDSPFFKSEQEIRKIKNYKPEWRRNGKILMMDTCPFLPNGCLSCIDLISGKLWQSY